MSGLQDTFVSITENQENKIAINNFLSKTGINFQNVITVPLRK